MSDNTQRQLQLQERAEMLSDGIIHAIERLEIQAIDCIINNDFETAEQIIAHHADLNGRIGGAELWKD